MTAMQILLAGPLLAIASAFDVGQRRIPNAVCVLLAAGGTSLSLWSGGWRGGVSGVGAALVLMAVLMPVWRVRALGGGDLKLAVACATWVGLPSLLHFVLATAVAGGVLSLACWLASAHAVRREVVANLQLAARRAMPPVSIRQSGGRVSVPYGVAISLAAVWTLWRG